MFASSLITDDIWYKDDATKRLYVAWKLLSKKVIVTFWWTPEIFLSWQNDYEVGVLTVNLRTPFKTSERYQTHFNIKRPILNHSNVRSVIKQQNFISKVTKLPNILYTCLISPLVIMSSIEYRHFLWQKIPNRWWICSGKNSWSHVVCILTNKVFSKLSYGNLKSRLKLMEDIREF